MTDSSSDKLNPFIFACWLVATVATLGSLFFSEIMKFPPCVLCWYQRIAMYPLAVIFMVGAFKGARSCFSYSLPVAVIGWIIALYHNLLHYGIVPESASPCMQGVSCATVYVNWFGFVTIPILSFTAFSIILVLLFFMKRTFTNEK